MALFTENMNPIAQEVSASWMPESPDMQADVRAICEKWGISSLDFDEQVCYGCLHYLMLQVNIAALDALKSFVH